MPKINTPQELEGYSFVVGGSLGIINGELIYDSETSELSAFRLGITASAISLINNFDLYGSIDSSILTKFKKLNKILLGVLMSIILIYFLYNIFYQENQFIPVTEEFNITCVILHISYTIGLFGDKIVKSSEKN